MNLEHIQKLDKAGAAYLDEALKLRDQADELLRRSQAFYKLGMRQLRSKYGASAAGFGTLCGITPQYVFALEAGRAKWNNRMILKLEESLRQKEAALASEDNQGDKEANDACVNA